MDERTNSRVDVQSEGALPARAGRHDAGSSAHDGSAGLRESLPPNMLPDSQLARSEALPDEIAEDEELDERDVPPVSGAH